MADAGIDLRLPTGSVSLWREMGAYEALWSEKKAWFKALAERFSANPGSVPSDFFMLHDDVPEQYAKKTDGLLEVSGVSRYGIRVYGTGEYPERLRDAQYPVELFYYQGYWDLIETRSVAVVGTRNPSEEGKRRTEKLVRLLVRDGFTIVSGLANGIDTVAHQTAMREHGSTIAVIGTPLGESYPKQNRELQTAIGKDHLLVSQVPVCRYHEQDWRSNRFFFPERNITMSALTEATIIVEASDTSGTLTQARAALRQGRKLFILDSCFNVPGLKWPHAFEKEEAVRVKSYGDITAHLNA